MLCKARRVRFFRSHLAPQFAPKFTLPTVELSFNAYLPPSFCYFRPKFRPISALKITLPTVEFAVFPCVTKNFPVTLDKYFLADGTVETKPISVDCYMSGKDLQATFLNMYKTQELEATFLNMYKTRELEASKNYVLSLCDGTKKIWVKNALITTPNVYENANEAELNSPLKFDTTESEEYSLALYNHQMISPDGSTSTYGYVRFYPSVALGTYNDSAIMQLTKSTRGDVVTESYVYVDLNGRVLQKVDEYGVTTTYEYHTDGSLKKQTIKSGDQSMVVYENTQSASADGKYNILTDKSFNLGEKYTYHNLFGALDKVERLCYNESTETVYNTTNYGYDSYYEQLLSVSSTADNQTHTNTLTYEDGVLSTVTDGKVNYKFTYDKATDTATFKVKDGTVWKTLEETESDHDLNTAKHTYCRNDSTTPTDTFVYTTDKYGKPVSISYNGEQKVTYNYTEGSESQATWVLASVNDQFCDRTYTYEYNADGSQKSVGFGGFKVTKVNESEKEYEIGSYNIKQTIGQGENAKQIVNAVNDTAVPVFSKTYTYDNFGRLDQETNAEENVATYTYGYETGKYNAPNYLRYGKLKIEDNILLTTTTYHNLVREENLTYDERGNIHTIVESGSASRDIRTMIIGGSLIERTESDDYYENSKTYTYDALGRIKTEVNTLLGINRSYTYNNNGRISDFGGTSCVYDNRGRLTGFGSTTLTYDNYGNRLTKGSTGYTWTRGRLLASVGGTTFEYDYQGRRTKKGSTTYYYDGDKLIAEVRSNNTLYYFYDAKGVCGFRYNGEDYEYIKNLFGDIVGIAQGVTLVARYEYDIWGNCTVAYDPEGIGAINPFRYRGYYFDAESGLYYLQSRYYDSSVGQFISPNTMQALQPNKIGGVDLYCYANNNPIEVAYSSSSGGESVVNQLINQSFNLLIIRNLGMIENKTCSIVHWKNEWFATDWLPSFFVFSEKKGALLDWGLSIYKGSLYFDVSENHSIYIGVGNVSAFVGYNVEEDKYGVFAEVNVLSVGYDGRYIDASISVVGVGFILGWEDEKFRFKIDPPGWFGFDISIDFGQIFKDIFGWVW